MGDSRRPCAHHRHDAFDLALVVEDDLGFGGLEINRAAFGARLRQFAVKPAGNIGVASIGVDRDPAKALDYALRAAEGGHVVLAGQRVSFEVQVIGIL